MRPARCSFHWLVFLWFVSSFFVRKSYQEFQWFPCSVTCGRGKQWGWSLCDKTDCKADLALVRGCDTGVPCNGSCAEVTWSAWSSWSACSVTCGRGTKWRRTPANGCRAQCKGVVVKGAACRVSSPCPTYSARAQNVTKTRNRIQEFKIYAETYKIPFYRHSKAEMRCSARAGALRLRRVHSQRVLRSSTDVLYHVMKRVTCNDTGLYVCELLDKAGTVVDSVRKELLGDGCRPRLCTNQQDHIRAEVQKGSRLNVTFCVTFFHYLPEVELHVIANSPSSSLTWLDRVVLTLTQKDNSSLEQYLTVTAERVEVSNVNLTLAWSGRSGRQKHLAYIHVHSIENNEEQGHHQDTESSRSVSWRTTVAVVCVVVVTVVVIVAALVVIMKRRGRFFSTWKRGTTTMKPQAQDTEFSSSSPGMPTTDHAYQEVEMNPDFVRNLPLVVPPFPRDREQDVTGNLGPGAAADRDTRGAGIPLQFQHSLPTTHPISEHEDYIDNRGVYNEIPDYEEMESVRTVGETFDSKRVQNTAGTKCDTVYDTPDLGGAYDELTPYTEVSCYSSV